MHMKILGYILASIILIIVILWIILWSFSHKTYPVDYGISFSPDHASSLGLDWKETYIAMLTDLKPTYIRIAAMWSDIEHDEGTYDFSNVDWMMEQAVQQKTKVVLVVGQKAPRWPECHVPGWVSGIDSSAYHEKLLAYVKAVIEHYKDNPALELWQVENEAFIRFAFGECARFDTEAVSDELEYVRQLDPAHKIVMTDSGELSTWRLPATLSDIFGTTLYRKVRTPQGYVFSYNFLPAGFYRLKAALWGKSFDSFFVSELQGEPWFTTGSPLDTSVSEMEKTMNSDTLANNMSYATHVGASRVYLWGVEWWYFMKTQKNDSRYWDLIQQTIASSHS